MSEKNYHVVIVITGQKLLGDKDSFLLLSEFEELFYAHYLLLTYIDSDEHEKAGTSKVLHLNDGSPKVRLEFEKHLKLADLVVCVGLNKEESNRLEHCFELLPSDCSIFELSDKEGFFKDLATHSYLNQSISNSIKNIINILQ